VEVIEVLSFSFVQNALIAGLLLSVISGVMGTLIVVNRLVFLSGGIAHSSYGGIGVAIYFGFSISLGSTIFAVLSALIVAWLTVKNSGKSDTFIGVIWAVGMAIGVVFIDLTPGYSGDLMSYLFGSILAVDDNDIHFMTLLMVVVIIFVHLFYREILSISYDREYAVLRGVASNIFFGTILILSALTIVVSIKVVGLILVIALMTIPTFIAEKLAKSLYGMMAISVILSMFFVVSGLVIGYIYDLTSGASIILVSATALMLFLPFENFMKGLRR
jgi:zinc transport system permease protein